jgi:hypothetical protein
LEEPEPEFEPESSFLSSEPPPPGPEFPPEPLLSSEPEWLSVLVPPLDPNVPLLELPLADEEPPLSSPVPSSSPVVVADDVESPCLRSSFFLSDFLESSASAFGSAFPCGLTGTERGVAAIVPAELR